MKRRHIFLVVGLLAVLVSIQFIQPARNISMAPMQAGISASFPLPEDIHEVMLASCYDCHSNNTRYPWYAHVQPVGWWLASHIQDGKRNLNFDEFASFSPRRQYRKLKEIEDQLNSNEMPLPSYTLVHRSAVVLPVEKTKIVQWCEAMRDSMRMHFPLDSLERKPKQ
jgi:hypothetical protein